jgi:thymidylate kinase
MLRRVRPVAGDRMEQEPPAFYEDVCAAYRDLARTDAQRLRLIDGNRSIEQIENEIWKELSARFPALVSFPQSNVQPRPSKL